jgi:hypothetical protein
MAQVKLATATQPEQEIFNVPEEAGRIHSIDSFSAVDGPGVRMVVFEQVMLSRYPWLPFCLASSTIQA